MTLKKRLEKKRQGQVFTIHYSLFTIKVMDIKQILKNNKITQEELALYVGMTREALNINLNKGEPKKGLVNNVKLLVLEKKGIKFDVDLELN